MKKKQVILGISLLAISLSACRQQVKEQSNNESSTQKTSASTKENSQSTSSAVSSSKKATTKTTSQTTINSTTTAKDKTAPDTQAADVLQQLADAFPRPLPQAILTSQTAPFLTAATTNMQDQANFRVLYYAQQTAINVNDPQVNELSPIASFEKKTYASAEEAAAAVNQIIDNNGMKVDLGYGITGYQQGAAGSSYLSWQEGNWSLVVRASNIEGEKAEPLAKEAVAYLEKAMLPAPQNVGQITLTTNTNNQYQNNSVVWQKGNNVYTIQHFDAIQALKMAVSTN